MEGSFCRGVPLCPLCGGFAEAVPSGGRAPDGTGSPCPGGGGHPQTPQFLPPPPPPPCPPPPSPRSPLSLATGTAHRKACSIGFAPKRRLPAAPGTCLAGTISAVDGSVQGCRGRSPRRNKLWDSPFPPGRGAGGWGKEIKPKARLAGDQPGKPPFGHRQHPPPRRPAGHATPSGTTAAGIAGKQKGAPRGTCVPRGAPRAKKPGKLLNYLLSFLITRLS